MYRKRHCRSIRGIINTLAYRRYGEKEYKMNNAKMYHNQADVDKWAKEPDDKPGIITASMKAIQEAYKEFIDDLMLEAQEAY